MSQQNFDRNVQETLRTQLGLDGVVEVHRRFGTRPFAELAAPAIALARDGFPVSLHLAAHIADFAAVLRAFPATAATTSPSFPIPRLRSRRGSLGLARRLVVRRQELT